MYGPSRDSDSRKPARTNFHRPRQPRKVSRALQAVEEFDLEVICFWEHWARICFGFVGNYGEKGGKKAPLFASGEHELWMR